jgi:phosphopantothenoylcysteine decarboxylase/phosphopantothenate--cysteine ligase
MLDAVTAELSSRKYAIAIMAAAVADFAPKKKSEIKIDSRAGKFEVELVKTAKIVDQVKKISKGTTLVAFKAVHNVDERTLADKAFQKLKESNADIVVANDVGKVAELSGPDKNEVFVIDRRKKIVHLPLADKNVIARKILDILVRTQSDSK